MSRTGSFLASVRVLSLLLVSMISANAYAQNIISNPGFENSPTSPAPWYLNNWAKCDVRGVVDSQEKRSGQYSYRMDLIDRKGGSNVEFMTPALPQLTPGKQVRLGFWLRGSSSNLPEIKAIIRKRQAPYTFYFPVNVPVTSQWQYHSFVTTLPSNTDASDTALFFTVSYECSIWLDDVSLEILPDQSTESPLIGNQIYNGSFESGRERWYAEFREGGFYNNSDDAETSNIQANIISQSDASAVHGRKVLAFEVFPRCVFKLNSAYFPMRYGVDHTVRFWLKSSTAGAKVEAAIGHGHYLNVNWVKQSFTVSDTQWHEYQFTVRPTASTNGRYFFQLFTESPAQYQLDAVMAYEGETPSTSQAFGQLNLGWVCQDDSVVANIYDPMQPARFLLAAAGASPNSNLTLHYRIRDAWEQVDSPVAVTMAVDAQGNGQAEIQLPTQRLGSMKAEFYTQENPSPDAIAELEILYHVVQPFSPMAQRRDQGFYGAHGNYQPYNMEILKRAGVTWLRAYPPLVTLWAVMEYPTGQPMTAYLKGVRRASEAGFSLSGILATVPKPYSANPSDATQNAWYSYAPAEDKWNLWRAYCQTAVRSYAPYITHWEVWNEPDINYLLLTTQQKNESQGRAKVYDRIVRETRQAIESQNLNVKLAGPAYSNILDNVMTADYLSLNTDANLDIVSVHYYGSMPPARFQQKLAAMKNRIGRSGQVHPIWVTEQGVWIGGETNTWLKTSYVPPTVSKTMGRDAAEEACLLAYLKASGIQRVFHYIDKAHPAGRTVWYNQCSNLIDINGIPHATFGAYAASAYFLDLASPVDQGPSRIQAANGANLWKCRFQRDGNIITVLWSSDQSCRMQDIPGLSLAEVNGYDMMGNRMSMTQETLLHWSPIYLVENVDGMTQTNY